MTTPKLSPGQVLDQLAGFCKRTNSTLHVQPDGCVNLQGKNHKGEVIVTCRYDGKLGALVAEHGARVMS